MYEASDTALDAKRAKSEHIRQKCEEACEEAEKKLKAAWTVTNWTGAGGARTLLEIEKACTQLQNAPDLTWKLP